MQKFGNSASSSLAPLGAHLISQILAHIRLMEHDDPRGIQFPRIDRTPCGDSKTERHIRHAIHDHTLVFGRVFGDSSEVRFEDVVAVEEGKFAGGFDPDL